MGAEAGFIMAVAGIGTLVVILITFGIVAGLRVVGYKHLYFTVGPDEFTLCSGIFNKKQVHVPYQRVRSVDQRATLPSAIVRRVYGFHRHGRRRGEQGRRGALRHQGPGRVAARRALQPQECSGRSGCRCVGHGGCSEYGRDGHGGCGRPGSAVGGGRHCGYGPGAAAFAGNVPSPAVAGNVLDVGVEAWNQVGGVFAGPAQDTGRVTYEYGLTNKGCSSRVFPTPHRWGSSSPVWLSACCKSSVSSST